MRITCNSSATGFGRWLAINDDGETVTARVRDHSLAQVVINRLLRRNRDWRAELTNVCVFTDRRGYKTGRLEVDYNGQLRATTMEGKPRSRSQDENRVIKFCEENFLPPSLEDIIQAMTKQNAVKNLRAKAKRRVESYLLMHSDDVIEIIATGVAAISLQAVNDDLRAMATWLEETRNCNTVDIYRVDGEDYIDAKTTYRDWLAKQPPDVADKVVQHAAYGWLLPPEQLWEETPLDPVAMRFGDNITVFYGVK